MGWLEGGYQTLIDALAATIRELGGEIHAGDAVDEIARHGRRRDRPRRRRHASGRSTTCSARSRLRWRASCMSPALLRICRADPFRYLGVVCLLLRLARSISPYYHLNITDRRIPLTTVVETTHVVDPEHVGGHLLYVSKYVDPVASRPRRARDEIERDYLGHARTMLPDLRDEDCSARSSSARGSSSPCISSAARNDCRRCSRSPGLALASTAHVYPEIVSGQASSGVSARVGRRDSRTAFDRAEGGGMTDMATHSNANNRGEGERE